MLNSNDHRSISQRVNHLLGNTNNRGRKRRRTNDNTNIIPLQQLPEQADNIFDENINNANDLNQLAEQLNQQQYHIASDDIPINLRRQLDQLLVSNWFVNDQYDIRGRIREMLTDDCLLEEPEDAFQNIYEGFSITKLEFSKRFNQLARANSFTKKTEMAVLNFCYFILPTPSFLPISLTRNNNFRSDLLQTLSRY